MMRLAVAVAAIALAATPAFADDWDFVLVNNSGKEIKLVEISPTGAAKWEKSRVDEGIKRTEVLKTGDRMSVLFDKAGTQCRYDLRGTFTDDTNAIWTNINVCDNAFVTIKFAGDKPTFTAN